MEIKIAICGTLRSGKDTVANMIQDNHDFCKFAFAEGIWATIELLFPEVYAKRQNEKPRKLLQDLGQGIRKIDPDVWVRYTFNRIKEVGAERVLVTDLRQPNEFDALKKAGFFIIRVNAEPEIRIERARAAGDNFNFQDLLHETEKHVQSFRVDFDIYNNTTLEDLENQVQTAFEEAKFFAQTHNPKGGKIGGF